MGNFTPEKNRTIALVGHGNTGKTSLVEAALFIAGTTSRMGSVDAGSTKTDYDPDEIKRKCSIRPVPVTVEWADHQINIVDCPGFADFLPEVRTVLGAMNGAVLAVSAQAGVEAQTEQVWETLTEESIPTIVVINRMDQENADFDKVLGQLGNELKGRAFAPFVVPIGAAGSLTGAVDLVANKAYNLEGEGKFSEGEIPDDLKEMVASYRDQLTEAAAEATDELTEKYLETMELSESEIADGLKIGVATGKIVPVVCTSAANAIGVPRLLDTVKNYIPAVGERAWKAKKPGTDDVVEVQAGDSEFSGLIFKVLVEQHVGELAILRVVSGSVKTGDTVLNASTGEKEKIGQIMKMVGKDRTETPSLQAGEIGALVKLKSTKLGHTLCSEKRPVEFEVGPMADPTMTQALKPQTQSDSEKLGAALHKILVEDPGISCELNPITHQFVVAAHGDLQMETFFARLERAGVHVGRSKPRVPYKETVRGKAEAEGKVKKQSGGRGQFAVVNLRVEPLPGGGFEFVDAVVGGVVPKNFIPSVEKGLVESLPRGVIAGYPVTDVKVTLYFGKYHDVDSSEMAFKTAASIGFKAAALQANPVLLEPIMNVRIIAPESYTGDLIGDLNSRRGKIQGMDPVGSKTRINAHVPLAELHNYLANLRAITGGRVEYGLEESHYEEVPAQVAEGVIKAVQAEKEAEHG